MAAGGELAARRWGGLAARLPRGEVAARRRRGELAASAARDRRAREITLLGRSWSSPLNYPFPQILLGTSREFFLFPAMIFG